MLKLRKRELGYQFRARAGPRREIKNFWDWGAESRVIKSDPPLCFVRFLVDSRSNTLKQAVKTMTACAENKQLEKPCHKVKPPEPGSNPGGPTK
jgi:hypothetical protein